MYLAPSSYSYHRQSFAFDLGTLYDGDNILFNKKNFFIC